jgi:hypothetical protein
MHFGVFLTKNSNVLTAMAVGCLASFRAARFHIALTLLKNDCLSFLPTRIAYTSGDWLKLLGLFLAASTIDDRSQGWMPALRASTKHWREQYFFWFGGRHSPPHIAHSERSFSVLGLLRIPFLRNTLARTVALWRTVWQSLEQHFRVFI